MRKEFELAVKYQAIQKYHDALPHFNNAIALSTKRIAQFYCARAGTKIDLEDFRGALADCDEAIKLNPKLAGAYSRRGFAYGALGKYDRAVGDLTTAINLRQIDCFRWNDYFDYDNRAKAYRSLGKRIEAQKDEAVAKTLHLIKNAYMLRESIETKKALDLMQQVVKSQPESMSAHYMRGICALNYNQNDLAIQDFSFLLQKNPACMPAYYLRADAYSKANKIEPAIKDYSRIIEANPVVVTACDTAETGRYHGDQSSYDSSVIWTTDIYVLRAMLYRQQKKIDLAMKDLNKAIAMAPDDYEAVTTLASTYIDINKCDETVKLCSQLINKKVELHSAYQTRAQALERLGKPDKAIEDLTSLIGITRGEVDGYMWRADAYARQKEYRKAISDYTVVLESGQDEAILARRADLYMKVGETDRAIADYTSAIALEPHASLYEGRAKAYEKLGRADLAKKDREKMKAAPIQPNKQRIKD